MKTLKNLVLFVLIVTFAMSLAACGNGGRSAQPTTPPPASTRETVPPAPKATDPAPAATAPAPTTGCISNADVKAILEKWHAQDAGNPGPAIADLDALYEHNFAANTVVGETWLQGGHKINRGDHASAIVWMNTNHLAVTLNGTNAAADKWVPLFNQGAWGIYVAYDDVTVPNAGRLAWTCEVFHPDTLSYWK